ncbi:MAG TPA: TonB-dependent receptor [Candidatus Polarisedimenticolaceae bacterium]|nr:TonB-dependent receptor [Candidatus Polarisedimenticolaceae bacterium]
MRRVLLALIAFVTLAHAQSSGGIQGVVLDQTLQIPLAGVSLTLAELGQSATSDADGKFSFEHVPPGRYTILAEKGGYAALGVPGIPVGPGKATEQRIELMSEAVVTEETTVTAEAYKENKEAVMLEERREAPTVQDAVSSDVISKAGAGDASGALKMVVGTSVAAGKYVSVRGLSDRYTGTTVNGVRVPSADPRRRAVQVDLFPTGTIDSVTVTKTFTPDLQGDFTGGGVDIKTRNIPGKVLSVGVTSEFNSIATYNDNFLTYAGGGVNTLGFSASDRPLPDSATGELPAIPAFPAFGQNPTEEQMAASQTHDANTRAFSPVMGISRSAPGVNTGLSVTAGDWYQVGDKGVFGAMASFTYSSKYDQYTLGQNNSGGVSDPSAGIGLSRERKDSKGTEELLMGLLGNLTFQPSERHELSLRVLGTQSDEDEARFQVEDVSDTTVEQNQALHYTERDLLSAQLHGVHKLGKGTSPRWEIDWTGARNRTQQNEPDVRFFRSQYDLSTFGGRMPANSTEAQNTRRIWRDIDEDSTLGQLDAKFTFPRFAGKEGFVKAGVYREGSDRGYTQNSYTYLFPTQAGSFIDPRRRANLALSQFTGDDAYDLWTDVFLNPERIGIATSAPAENQLLWTIVPVGNDVNYTGDQTIQAGYGMVSVPLLRRLELIAGARYESTKIAVDPTSQSGQLETIVDQGNGNRSLETVPVEEAATDLEDSAVLPSVNVIFQPRDSMNVRASWTRTLARPTFRELAPVATEEFIFGDEYFGNPDLELSTIENYDLRWEWFRRSGEVLALSAFTKRIQDPIEMISFSAANRSFIQPVNYETGRAKGAELEARTGLDLLGRFFSRLTLGLNATWMDTEVDLPPDERASLAAYGLDQPTRQLQGQPAYVGNLNVVYDNADSGTSIGAFYNVTGETLVSGAGRGQTDGTPDVFEKSYGTLDLSMSQLFLKRLTVTVRFKNLLTPTRTSVYRTPGGEEAIKSERDTPLLVGIGVGLKW